MATKPIPKARVCIVDDEPLIRRAFRLLLLHQPEFELCGEAENSEAAVQVIATTLPDVLLVDLTLKHETAFALIRRARKANPALRILVFSMHDTIAFVEAAFRAGANGYVSKAEGIGRLLGAMRQLVKGRPYLPTALAARLPLGCDWYPPDRRQPWVRH